MERPFFSRLDHRTAIRIDGADRRAFLQGLISNDINLCTPARAIYAALLTPQGKFLHDLFIVDAGDDFLIDCESARADDLLKRLTAYKLRAKVTLENASEQYDIWVQWGEQANPLASSRPRAPTRGRDDALLYDDPRLPELGFRAIVKKGAAPESEITDFSAYDKHRLALGVADGSRDMIVEKSTLLEGNFDLLNGISWSKGCYMGQELTARMHYRALAKKRLLPVKIEDSLPASGTIIQLNGEEVGEMRSGCGDFGLALLNIEKARTAINENTSLVCGESQLRPYRPEWLDLDSKSS